MKAPTQLNSLVSQMPDPDDRGTFSNSSKETVERAIAEIHAGGREYVLGLIDMLEDLDDVQNVYSNADIPEDVLVTL